VVLSRKYWLESQVMSYGVAQRRFPLENFDHKELGKGDQVR